MLKSDAHSNLVAVYIFDEIYSGMHNQLQATSILIEKKEA